MDKFVKEAIEMAKDNWKVIGIVALVVLAAIFGEAPGV